MSNKINLYYDRKDKIAELSFEENGIFLKFTSFIFDLRGEVYQVDHEDFLDSFISALGRNSWMKDLLKGLEDALLTVLGYIQGKDELPNQEVFAIISPIIEKEKKRLSDFTSMGLRGGAGLVGLEEESKCTLMQIGGNKYQTHILVGFYKDRSLIREIRCPWKLLPLNKLCLFTQKLS